MRRIDVSGMAVAVLMMVFALLASGCASSGKVWTWNQRQALSRSGGDVAMTALLDQGVDKAEAVELCNALIVFLESGDVSRAVFQKHVYEVIPVRYADWADALLTVVDDCLLYTSPGPRD